MGMEGDLASLETGELLQVLQLGGKSGALVLSRTLEEVVLWVRGGRLVAAQALRGDRLSAAWTLYLEGACGADGLRSLLADAGGEESLLERLALGELLEPRRSRELLRRHVLRLLVELAGWRSGHFAFDEKGPSTRPAFALEPALDLGAEWLEVLRRRDEIDAALAECRRRGVQFAAREAGRTDAPLSPRALRLLERIGPRADLDAVFEAFAHARYEALEAVRELLGADRLEAVAGGAPVALERFGPAEDATLPGTGNAGDEEEIEFWEEGEEAEAEAQDDPAYTETRATIRAPSHRALPESASRASAPGARVESRAAAAVHAPDAELRRQVRLLTEELDELVPGLTPYEAWRRRLAFAAFSLALLLAALVLLALNLGWHRPLAPLLEAWLGARS